MNIHEYQAKSVLRNYEIQVPQGIIINNKNEIKEKLSLIDYERYVIKSQVHSGGRGMAGGIQFASDKRDTQQVAENMLGSILHTVQSGSSGIKINKIYIEEKCEIDKEYYVSIVFHRPTSSIVIIGSAEGGQEIEGIAKTHPDKIKKIYINHNIGLQDFHIRRIGFELNIHKDYMMQFKSVIKSMYRCFVEKELIQLEINPLIQNKFGFVALDAKMNCDSNALFRHSDMLAFDEYDEENSIEKEALKFGLNYIKLHGNVGCMVNGAGLAMATMDIVQKYEASPANFLDVGGGATIEAITKACDIIMNDKEVKVIFINIFGGIMKCDIIAHGLLKSIYKNNAQKLPIVARLVGTNFNVAQQIIQDAGFKNIILLDDLEVAAAEIANQLKENN